MATKKYLELSETGLAKTGAIIGFIMWLVGLFWHGMMAQPPMMSMMYNLQYTGSYYMSAGVLGSMLVMLVVGGFVFGWLIAAIYNWALKK